MFFSPISDQKENLKYFILFQCVNAGQTCIAPDYVYCHKKLVGTLIERMKHHIADMYGDDPEKSDCFARYCRHKT